MLAQYTAASLVSENKVLPHPASVDTIPTSGKQEDHVSMGWTSVRKLREVIGNVRTCLAVEILCATQGIDQRASIGLPSVPVAAVHDGDQGADPGDGRGPRGVGPDHRGGRDAGAGVRHGRGQLRRAGLAAGWASSGRRCRLRFWAARTSPPVRPRSAEESARR